MKTLILISTFLFLSFSSSVSQTVTFDIAKIGVDTFLKEKPYLKHYDFFAIDLFNLDLSKQDHDSLINYLHTYSPIIIETSYVGLLVNDTIYKKGYTRAVFVYLSKYCDSDSTNYIDHANTIKLLMTKEIWKKAKKPKIAGIECLMTLNRKNDIWNCIEFGKRDKFKM